MASSWPKMSRPRSSVQTAETIWQAKRKCPDLVLLPAHHRVYREFSRRINRMYQDYTDLVEPFGIDESWLDVSGTLHLFGGDPTLWPMRSAAGCARSSV